MSGTFPALLALEMKCKDTKGTMGELEGMTPLQASLAIPVSAPIQPGRPHTAAVDYSSQPPLWQRRKDLHHYLPQP